MPRSRASVEKARFGPIGPRWLSPRHHRNLSSQRASSAPRQQPERKKNDALDGYSTQHCLVASVVWFPSLSHVVLLRRFPHVVWFPPVVEFHGVGLPPLDRKMFWHVRGQPIEYRFSANTQIVDTFQRRSADPANHRVAIAAHQRIGHRPLTYRTIPFNRTLTSGHTAIMERRKPPGRRLSGNSPQLIDSAELFFGCQSREKTEARSHECERCTHECVRHELA